MLAGVCDVTSDMWPSPCPPAPIMHHSSSSPGPPPPPHPPPWVFFSAPPPLTGQQVSPHHQVNSAHLPRPQLAPPSPDGQVCSPHLYQPAEAPPLCGPWPPHLPQQDPPPPYGSSPQFMQQVQAHQYLDQNQDPGLDPGWSRAGLSYQDQTPVHMDLQDQNQVSAMYEPVNRPGPVQDPWDPAMGRWISVDFSSSPAEEDQFFHSAPQRYCTAGTTGPGPGQPQTISGPGLHSPAKTLSCCLQDYNRYPSPLDLCQPQTQTQTQTQHQNQTQHQHQHQTQHQTQHQAGLQAQHQTGLLQSHRDQIQNQAQHQAGLLLSHRDQIQNQTQHQTGLQTQTQHQTQTQNQTGLQHQTQNQTGLQTQKQTQRQTGLLQSHRDQIQNQTGLQTQNQTGVQTQRQIQNQRGLLQNQDPGAADWTWVNQRRPKVVPQDPGGGAVSSRLQCSVCQRDFRSLPALNGHMRCHGGGSHGGGSHGGGSHGGGSHGGGSHGSGSQGAGSHGSGSQGAGSQGAGSHKGGSRPAPWLVSPASTSVATPRVWAYQSLLHKGEEPAVGGGASHYTPPPMLSPVRPGPGLFCSVATRGPQHTHDGLWDAVAMGTVSPPPGTPSAEIRKPRINVGRGFQAEIPPIKDPKHAHSDSHHALLQWTPWAELEQPVNQQRVAALLTMASSSVVPEGGASPESALRVLTECQGDFLLTVEKLLSAPGSGGEDRTAQQQPRGVWSPAERRLLLRSLQLHQKDFIRIQQTVQTKSLSQCVEFYYRWKKKLGLSTRTPVGLPASLPDASARRRVKGHQISHDAL